VDKLFRAAPGERSGHICPATEGVDSVKLTSDPRCYGASVTGDMAYGLAQRGICVISGLAYGIDAHAHRAALAGSQGEGPATLAVLAGGLDRDYPSGNADLAAAIRGNGLTLSELPPGSAPTRYRFLQRKRQLYVFKTSWLLAVLARSRGLSPGRRNPPFHLLPKGRRWGGTFVGSRRTCF
jgi:hypothetical protein